jgi:hypothetical protein
VRVADVQRQADGRRAQAADEITDGERVVGHPRRRGGRRVGRRAVLDRDRHAQRLGPLREPLQRPLLGGEALTQPCGRRAALRHREVHPVVDDQLRTRLCRVVHQPVEGPVVLDGPGTEVGGTVEEEPQAVRNESRAQGTRVASATLSIGQHGARRGVDLHPREPGRLIGVQQGGRGPLVTMDVEAEAGAELDRHVASIAPTGSALVTAR